MEAKGADRKIDAELALVAGWTHEKMKGDQRPYWRKPGEARQFMRSELPTYTGSVDAAIAFINLVLPGRAAELLREAMSDLGKRFAWHIRTEKPGEIAMLPLALLAVGLSALILKEKADG